MSSKYTGLPDDYMSAANRHLQGSITLLKERQHEESAYLAGYVSECALKKMVQKISQNDSSIYEHSIPKLSNQLLGLILKNAQYSQSKYIPSNSGKSPVGSIMDWDPILRYKSDGTISQSAAQQWLEEATEHHNVLLEMWRDGYS